MDAIWTAAIMGFVIPLIATMGGRTMSPGAGRAAWMLSNLPGLGLTACGAMFGTPQVWLIAIPGILGGAIGYTLVALMDRRRDALRKADREGPK